MNSFFVVCLLFSLYVALAGWKLVERLWRPSTLSPPTSPTASQPFILLGWCRILWSRDTLLSHSWKARTLVAWVLLEPHTQTVSPVGDLVRNRMFWNLPIPTQKQEGSFHRPMRQGLDEVGVCSEGFWEAVSNLFHPEPPADDDCISCFRHQPLLLSSRILDSLYPMLSLLLFNFQSVQLWLLRVRGELPASWLLGEKLPEPAGFAISFWENLTVGCFRGILNFPKCSSLWAYVYSVPYPLCLWDM